VLVPKSTPRAHANRPMRRTLAIAALGASLFTLAQVSRAQVLQGMTSAGRQFTTSGTSIYRLGLEHRGVQLELRAHTWGLSAPGFTVEVWNDDPAASEFFDVLAAEGFVELDGRQVPLTPLAPSPEHPLGGRRAVILPAWSTWPSMPFTGRDLEFELTSVADPSASLRGRAEDVRG
jgi:hypothetical protein